MSHLRCALAVQIINLHSFCSIMYSGEYIIYTTVTPAIIALVIDAKVINVTPTLTG